LLRWRITLGILFSAALLGLCWLDFYAPRPGLFLIPLAIVASLMSAGEVLGLYSHGSHQPIPWVIYVGTLLTVTMSATPSYWKEYPNDGPIGRLGWLALGMTASVLVALFGEVRRYKGAGGVVARLALSVLAIIHAGGLMGFIVQLRLLGDGRWGTDGHWGMVALLSMIAVVKVSDIGAYFAGKQFGRNKLAPVLSPGKTWEGLFGGLVAAAGTALVLLGPAAHLMGCDPGRTGLYWAIGACVYGLILAVAGVLGDLTVSLLKRDAGVKDSSRWMPGFGGVLDILDSLLVAAPVAYICWLLGLVGP
jgi:phosphatidate cytidylyltransferase